MTLIMRMTRLFKADMHGLLDLLEEPEDILKQAIRDMTCEIERGRQRLAECRQRDARLRRVSTDLERSINTYEEQLDIAFEAQHDDLARTFIRKKLEAEHRLQATARAIAETMAEVDELQSCLREQQTQLDAIIAKVPPDTEGHRVTEPSVASAGPSGVAEEDVEATFLREKRKRAAGGN